MKIGIVGYGHVGKAMHELFTDAYIYDEPLGIGERREINGCDCVFVCVPTPQGADGECVTSTVEEVISWIESKVIVLRSTVRVGFTDEMAEKYHKEIVFQPEYYGETVDHPFAALKGRKWLAFGGTSEGINTAINAYKTVMNSDIQILQGRARDVEFAKYMENSYLAVKVTFCNEMYDMAQMLGVDYNAAREIWTADPRIGRSHTFVYEDNRGYGGSCLPKDTSSIIRQGDELGYSMDMLKAVAAKNEKYKKKVTGVQTPI